MVELVLHLTARQIKPISRNERPIEFDLEAHLFSEPTCRGVQRGFALQRMRARRIRPEPPRMVFALSASLQQDPTRRIEKEHRHRTMQ